MRVAVATLVVRAEHGEGHRARAHRPRRDRDRSRRLLRTGVADLDPGEVDRLAHDRSIRRSIHRAPTVSVSPWAMIEARITNAATSKTSDRRWRPRESRTSSANSIEATPLGPNQAMNAFCGRGIFVPASESMHRDRARDEQREGDEGDQRQDRAVVAGGDDHRAEDEEGQHLEDRAHVLGEVGEALGDLVLGVARA